MVLKGLLQSKHELLAGEITDPVVFYKFLDNQISALNLENHNIKALSFSDTLSRVCKLIEYNIIPKSDFQFIIDNRKWLEEISGLRNRLLHRGMFILRYKALDELVGMYVLPFVVKLASVYYDENTEPYWKYRKINCRIDPILEIISLFKSGNYEMDKVALLKELGRAAYSDNLPIRLITKLHREEYIRTYEKTALSFELGVSAVKKCPVCGLNTLIVNEDHDGDQDDDGNYTSTWTYIWRVKCIHCSFELYNEMVNACDFYKLEHWFWEVIRNYD